MSRAPAEGRGRALVHVHVHILALVALAFSLAPHRAQAGVTATGGTVSARPIFAPPIATLDRASVPATGRQLALLSVERFGRVAVLAHSAQGVSLQLVDRVAGPSEVSGTPGEGDGRVEGFLDHGEYRVIVRGHEKSQGDARLEARPFQELSEGQPSLLPDVANLSTTLGDFQQRSWWVNVTERRNVALEAAGRALGDLRLWRDGQWLVDAEPERSVLTPDEGRPLTVLRFAPQLEPGLYLLTAYGAPPQPWAREDGSSPLYLRSGLVALASAHRQRHVMGPMGIERFSVPGDATFFRIELDEAPASLGVAALDAAAPFADPQTIELVTKETLPPAVEIRTEQRGPKSSLVTVSAPPGKAYILQCFDASERQPIPAKGRLFLTTVHSGHAEDSVDATGVLYSMERREDRHVINLGDRAIPLSGSKAWARRFNLLETTQVYFKVEDAAEYQVEISGVDAECVVEPFLVGPREGYESPKPRGSGSKWDLEAGLNVLTLYPERTGIADVAIRKAGLWDRLLESIGRERVPGVPALQPSVLIGDITLDSTFEHYLWIANRPGIASGLVARAAPVNLAMALPLALPEGERISVPVRVSEESTVRAELEDGTLLPLSLDGADAADEVLLPTAGEHHITLVAPATGGPRIFSLVATPRRASQGLPALPASLMPKPPDLPVLVEGQPRNFDLAKTESRTFLMKAGDGALYRVETTGLLATMGNLRTRTVTSLARANSGGTGRNFLVQQYLRSGDYHVTVQTLGMSAGHLGLSLKRAAMREGGELDDGVPSNATLPSGEAIAFQLDVKERSKWHLQAVALGRTLRCRLEEEGGWPVETPGGPADLERELEPGRYRFIVLPEPTSARVAVLATRLADPLKREGHGSFALPFDEVITHQWTEPAQGGERMPDRWTFTMTGTSEVTITLGNGMEGKLGAILIRSGRPWTGTLVGGSEHVLEVTSPRKDNRHAYTLSARPAKFMPGMSRAIVAPAEIELAADGSVARPGSSLELSSSGLADVRARLVDDFGQTVASSDDAPDDWNFRFDDVPREARRLIVEPVGSSDASTRVTFHARAAKNPGPALSLPLDRSFELPVEGVQAIALAVPGGEGLLIVSATSRQEVSLEARVPRPDDWKGWVRCDRDAGRSAIVAIPCAGGPGDGREVLLTLRSSRGGRASARVQAVIVRPASVDPMQQTTLTLGAVEGVAPGVFAASLARRQATILRLGSDHGASLRLVRAQGPDYRPVERVRKDLLALDSNVTAWLVGIREGGASTLALPVSRVMLKPGAAPERLRVGPDVIGCEVAATPSRHVSLVVVESAGAQPEVALDLNSPTTATFGTSWPGGAAAAIGEGPVSRAWMRLRDVSYGSTASAPARVSALDAGSTPRDPGSASWNGVADPTVTWQLPHPALRPQSIRLALDAGTFAVVTDGWRVLSVHGSASAATDETFEARDAALLHVVRAKDSTGRHSVEVRAVEGAMALTVSEAQGVEFVPSHAGRTRVTVNSSGAARLLVKGASRATLWRAPLDTVQMSTSSEPVQLAAGTRATLLLEHGLDPVAAWLEGDASSAWGSTLHSASPRAVTPPTSMDLVGETMTLRVESANAALLSLRTSHPIVTRLRQPAGQASQSEAWPVGARLDAWIPAGITEIDLRGFGSSALSGTATVALSAPIEMHEGLGDAVFVPAGDARAFTFLMKGDGIVGLGMRSSSEDIDVSLDGGAGTGLVQMPTLTAGWHVLVVSTEPGGGPVAIRPVLLGRDEPDTGPPLEILRQYVLGGESAPENAAPIPPDWHRWLGVQQQPTSGDGCDGCGESSGDNYSGEEGD